MTNTIAGYADNKHVILVTGANGFIGRALCRKLTAEGRPVRGVVRTPLPASDPLAAVMTARVPSIGPETDWSAALAGVGAIVHLVARTHVLKEDSSDPAAAYRRVNVEGTLNLARQAAFAGVRRFVFMSSVKVNGEGRDAPYNELDPPEPEDLYGLTKCEAEKELLRVASETGIETVVLRPPLVYGPGVKANFRRLMTLVSRRIPLPLGNVNNRRSMIFLDNLVDAVLLCLDHPGAKGRLYLVSDGADVSTPELLSLIGKSLGTRAVLLPFPLPLLRALGKLPLLSRDIGRLTGSLTVDSALIRSELGWKPPFSLEEGMAQTALWFRSPAGASAPS